MTDNINGPTSSCKPSECERDDGLDDINHPPWVKSLSEFYRFESKEVRQVGDATKNNRKRVFYNLQCNLCVDANQRSKKSKRGSNPTIINGNSTFTFIRHLNRSHKDVDTSKITNLTARTSGSYKRKYKEDEEETSILPVIGLTGKTSTEVKKYDENSIKQKFFRKHCLDWMIIDGVPLSSTEKKGFRQLMFSVDDRLNCPSRSTMMSLLDEKHKEILDHLRKVLKGLKPGTAHLILDIWSSRQKLSVIGVQVRFIKDWKLHQFVLGFQHFPGSHDAKAIKKKLEDLLTITYGLSMTDFLTVTADNASAILLAFKDTSYEPPPSISSEPTTGLGNGTGRIYSTKGPTTDTEAVDLEYDELPDIDDGTIEHDLVTDDDINKAIDTVILEWTSITDNRRSRNSCLAHLLQLGIKDALAQTEIAAIIKKVNAIVTWFHKSNKYYTALRDLTGLALVKPCDTRWNSSYHCMKRLTREIITKDENTYSEETFASLVNKSLDEARKTSRKTPSGLSLEEIHSLRTLVSLLAPFAELTDLWQGNGITSSTVIYGLVDALKELDNVDITSLTESESDPEDHNVDPEYFLEKFRRALRDSVLKRFGTDQDSGQPAAVRGRKIVTSNVVNDKYYILATLLDPKLKTIPFEESFMTGIGFCNGYPTKDEAIQLLKETYDSEKQKIELADDIQILPQTSTQLTPDNSTNKSNGSSSKDQAPRPKKRNIFERLQQHRASVASKDKNIDEIEHYISCPTISENENTLSFWRHNKDRFPILSSLAMKYLSMPATSASVERLFSVGGSIISSRRSSMAIETAEKLILYKDYLTQGKIEMV